MKIVLKKKEYIELQKNLLEKKFVDDLKKLMKSLDKEGYTSDRFVEDIRNEVKKYDEAIKDSNNGRVTLFKIKAADTKS